MDLDPLTGDYDDNPAGTIPRPATYFGRDPIGSKGRITFTYTAATIQ